MSEGTKSAKAGCGVCLFQNATLPEHHYAQGFELGLRLGLEPSLMELSNWCEEHKAIRERNRKGYNEVLQKDARGEPATEAVLRRALQALVADAKDEGRGDMRDSVDEQLVEEARLVLAGQCPARYRTP